LKQQQQTDSPIGDINSNNPFLISGTQIAHIKMLNGHHYTCVTDFSLKHNTLKVSGPIMASSESLTHSVIYQ